MWAMVDSSTGSSSALKFTITAKCSVSKARVSAMKLPHHEVDTPVFMPVGTQGTMKGVTPEQLQAQPLNCQIILGNTYHLANKPGCEVLTKAGGLHKFMNWDRALLTDSGGFQMVSLLKLANITEEGVNFRSPHDNTEMLLTPEHSIEIQNTIGADIIMQLDDVVSSLTTGDRVEEAMRRSIRWLDRCIKAHRYPNKQNLFGIVQGGLQPDLRRQCIKEMVKFDLPGYAIGGLSGGEKKNDFWKIVDLCTDLLPRDRPIYCMGVGYSVDLVVCCALGVDMFDCVFPTRTARFGGALVPWGQINLNQRVYEADFQPIDPLCTCTTCTHYTRAALHAVIKKDAVACSLLTIHNLNHHLSLMRSIRESITADQFPVFVQEFMSRLYPSGQYDSWVVDALEAVNIHLISP